MKKHLEKHRDLLDQRDEVQRGNAPWFALRSCDYYEIFDQRIIAWPDTAKSPRFCLLPKGAVIGNTAFCFISEFAWLLPLLNSDVGWKLITLTCQSRDERRGN